MKRIILEVQNDYDSNWAWEMYIDNLKCIAEELDIRVENENRRNTNILESINSYKKGVEYKNYIDVRCIGYSQSEWDNYKIYFDDLNDDIKYIAEELKRIYTHKNDYYVKQIEELDSGHQKTLDSFSFSILDVEFPENKDIKYRIDEEMIEYDEIEFNQN